MPTNKRSYFNPQSTYFFSVKISGIDFTEDLRQISIVSSLTTAYQIITLTFLTDVDDIISERIFGKDPIKLTATLQGRDEIPSEQINFELMFIDSNQQQPNKQQMSTGIQSERTPLQITTICRQPFKTMMTNVNDIFEGATIQNIIESLVSNFTDASLELDTQNINTDIIPQVIIPPTSLYKVIKEYDPINNDGVLDKYFGIYNGVPGVFCRHDNTIFIKNLTHRLKQSQTFNIYQLTTDGNNQDIINKSTDGKNFYTYHPLKSTYQGNAKMANDAAIQNYIVNPRDRLSHVITRNFTQDAEDYSITYKNPTTYTDPIMANRTKYIIGQAGNDYSETFAISQTSKQLSNLSIVRINIEREMPLFNLMEIGEPVKLITRSLEYVELSGKYILASSSLNFNRNGPDWESTAELTLSRSNKII